MNYELFEKSFVSYSDFCRGFYQYFGYVGHIGWIDFLHKLFDQFFLSCRTDVELLLKKVDADIFEMLAICFEVSNDVSKFSPWLLYSKHICIINKSYLLHDFLFENRELMWLMKGVYMMAKENNK